MKSYPQVLALGLLTLAYTDSATAQWVQTNGPSGGVIHCFTVSQGEIFAGVQGGVYRSTNHGATWLNTSVGLTYTDVRVIVESGTTLFAGTEGAGIFRSSDRGTSWIPVNQGLSDRYFYALTTWGTKLLAGGWGGKLFVSSNNGESWLSIETGRTWPNLYAIATIGDTLLAGFYGWGILVSPNGGVTWMVANTGLQYTDITCFTAQKGVVFAGTFDDGLLISTDRGMNWKRDTIYQPGAAIPALATYGDDLFAGTDSCKVFRSTDVGVTWSQFSVSLNAGLQALAMSGVSLLAGTNAGAFRYSVSDSVWLPMNSGLIKTHVRALLSTGEDIFAGTNGAERAGVSRSSDLGLTWDQPIDGRGLAWVYSFARQGPLLFAASYSGIERSSDRGITWEGTSTGLSPNEAISLLAVGPRLFAGLSGSTPGTGGVALSIDSGANWSRVFLGRRGWKVTTVPCLAALGSTVFAGIAGGILGNLDDYDLTCVLRTSDNASSWTAADSGLTDARVYALIALRGDLFAGTSRHGIFVSADSGATWRPASVGLPVGVTVRALVANGNHLFAGIDSTGVFYSSNRGETWSNASQGLVNLNVRALAIHDSCLLAGTDGDGVWKRLLGEIITGSKEQRAHELLQRVALEQNYPNPFNPTTTIRYSVPRRSRVLLTVYNTLGQIVTELVNGEIDVGYHTVQFDGSNLASGVYFYRLQVDSFVEVKKLLLVQ